MLRQCVMNQREVIDGSRLEQQTVYQNVSRRDVKVKVKIFVTLPRTRPLIHQINHLRQ